MLKFSSLDLIDIFCEEFIKEYGENKTKEIFQKIKYSDKINYYLNQFSINKIKPSTQDISIILNNIPYFIFSKAETFCTGGLATLLLWRARVDPLNEIFSDEEIVKICAEFIIVCSKLKIFKSNSIFQQFFDRINQIDRE